MPGEFPFTRGVQPTMYRGRLWTMRQYAGFASAAETNRRFRYLLDHGQTGLSVAFDLPTQMGYDADAAAAAGEVGRVGVPISSIDDMRDPASTDLPLGEVTTSMTINATAAILLAFYIAVADERGIPRATLGGTVQNDILKEYIARGTYIYPTGASMRLVTDIFEFCATELPRWNTISISGYHMREAGATAAQELAFTLADGIAYVEAARSRGLDVDAFAGRPVVLLRRLERAVRGGGQVPRRAPHVGAHHARPFRRDEPALDDVPLPRPDGRLEPDRPAVDNNVVRTTLQALAAVLGGTQSLHTNARDEALALPTRRGGPARAAHPADHRLRDRRDRDARSARRQLLRRDADRRARGRGAATTSIEIDASGGALAAIEAGYQQRQIQEAAYRVQREVEAGERIVVGVNRYRDDEVHTPELQRIDPAGEPEQVARVRRLRAERDEAEWAAALARLANAADGSGQPAAADHRRGQGAGRRWARSATVCAWPGASTGS